MLKIWQRCFISIMLASMLLYGCTKDKDDGGLLPTMPKVPVPTSTSIELTPATPAPTPTPTPSGCTLASDTVLGHTNYQRCLNGVAPLAGNSALNTAAQCHSDDMVARGYLSHTTPLPAPCGGPNFTDRIIAAGYPSPGGENVACGYPDAQAVVAAWMASSGHRRNILNPKFTAMGIGQNGTIWTQVFGF